MPKTVWTFWHDGEASAPPLVRLCIQSWREKNPEWEVVVLDQDSATQHVDVSFMPADTRIQLFTDVLRLELLRKHGGIWADATCLCNRPLCGWLPELMNGQLSVFKRPGPDRLLANWFLAAPIDNPLLLTWSEAARSYWKNTWRADYVAPNGRDQGFLHHYLFEWVVRTVDGANAEWEAVDGLDAWPSHAVQRWLRDQNARSDLRDLALAALQDTPVQKLDWRLDQDGERLSELLAEKGVNGLRELQ